MSTYVIAPTGADIMHFGKGHDDNPPGRGSGRYAWGTGNGDGAKERRGIVQKQVSKSVSKTQNRTDLTDRQKVKRVTTAYTIGQLGQIVVNNVLAYPATVASIAGIALGSVPLAAAGTVGLAAVGVKSIVDTLNIYGNSQYDAIDTYMKAKEQ
jgi:hypothetical protein